MQTAWIVCFVNVISSFGTIDGEKPFVLTLERADVKYVDDMRLSNVTASVSKANRTAPYVLNFSMYLLQPWLDNITISSTSYEFKNNQYKKSFIQTSNTVCDVVREGDQFLTGLLRKFSNLPSKCPLPIGTFYVKDFILIETYFPTGFPISKWRFNYIIKYTTSNIAILKFDLYMNAEPRVKRRTAKPNKNKPK